MLARHLQGFGFLETLPTRHSGVGRNPVAFRSVVAKAWKTQLYRENWKQMSLGPGLRRDDDNQKLRLFEIP
jgi:hypothetical protein